MTDEQKKAQHESAKKAVVINLQATAQNLRTLGKSLGDYEKDLDILFALMERTAHAVHKNETLQPLSNFNALPDDVQKLYDEITTLKTELEESKSNLISSKQITPDAQEIIKGLREQLLELENRNGILVEQNLYLSTGKEFVDKLNDFVNAYNAQNERLKGIELSLITLTETAKVSQPEK